MNRGMEMVINLYDNTQRIYIVSGKRVKTKFVHFPLKQTWSIVAHISINVEALKVPGGQEMRRKWRKVGRWS
jgi:hypothetical protein